MTDREARRRELARLHGRLRTVAVTGTNGKTTTTGMIDAIVAAAGGVSARVTTLGMWVGDERVAEDGSMASFHRTVRAAVEAGVETLALETTSRALEGGFADRWPPHVAVFTNLSRDHLDRHGSPEAYLAAKARLFLRLPKGGVAVLNAADPASALVADVLPAGVEVRGFAVEPVSEGWADRPVRLEAETVEAGREGTIVTLGRGALAEALGGRLELAVPGAVHAANAIAAAVAAEAAGLSASAIAAGLAAFRGVPGRFQVVAARPLTVVDFAHTPDALERTLAMARELVGPEEGKVWVVFGCGGERDRGKRPEMGRIADEGADRVVLTNDNPRGEDPEAIADAVASGARGTAGWCRELDREAAIRLALSEAEPRDAVVIAGKGHEATQEIAGRVIRFSDAEVAARLLGSRAVTPP